MNVDLPYTDQERHFIGNFFEDGHRDCRHDAAPTATVVHDDYRHRTVVTEPQYTPYPYSTTYTTGPLTPHSTQPPPPPYVQPGTGGLVRTPTASDVLCGRGGRINSHRGNIRFRDLVSRSKHDYLSKTTTKLIKAHIAASIVTQIRNLCPPGRFLKVDANSGLWIDIGDDKARKKAGQALREDAKEVRKELEEQAVGSTQQTGTGTTSVDVIDVDVGVGHSEGGHDTHPTTTNANDAAIPSNSSHDYDKISIAGSNSYTNSPRHVAYNDETAPFDANARGAVQLTPPPPPVQYDDVSHNHEMNYNVDNTPEDSLAIPGLPYSPVNPAKNYHTEIRPTDSPCHNDACDSIAPNYSHVTPDANANVHVHVHVHNNARISPPATPHPPPRDSSFIRRETSTASELNNLILDSFYGMDDDEFSDGSVMLVEEFVDYFEDCDGAAMDDEGWLQQDNGHEMKLHDSQNAPDLMMDTQSIGGNETSIRSVVSKFKGGTNSLCSTKDGEEMSWSTERSNQNMAYWSSQTVSSWKELAASWSSRHSGNSFFIRSEEPQRREPGSTADLIDDDDEETEDAPKRDLRLEWRQQMLKVKAWRQRKNRILEQYNDDANVTDESDNEDDLRSRDVSPFVKLGRNRKPTETTPTRTAHSSNARDASPVVNAGRIRKPPETSTGTPKRRTAHGHNNGKFFKTKERHESKKHKERTTTRDPAIAAETTTITATTLPKPLTKRRSFAESKLRFVSILKGESSKQKSVPVPPPPPRSIPVQHRQRQQQQQQQQRDRTNGNETASLYSTSNSTVSRLYSDYDFMKSFRTMTSVSSGAVGDGSTRSLISELSTDLLSLDLGVRRGSKLGAALPKLFYNRKR